MNSTANPSCSCRSLDLLQDLPLHDDVERGRRLVHDHELRVERERHGDDHALAHAARELVCVGARAALVDADEVEQLAGALERVALRDVLVRAHHVDELVADAHHRVERVHRALEDHRDVAPAVLAQLLRALRDQVVAAEEDAAADDLGRRAQHLHDAVRDRRLAAAGLAGEAEDLAGGDRQVDAVDRDDVAVGDAEVAHLDERLALGIRRHGGSSRSATVTSTSSSVFFIVRSRGLLSSSIPASRKTSPTTVDHEREAGEEERPPFALQHGRVGLRPVEDHPPADMAWCHRGRGTRGPASTRSAT